MEKKFKAPAFSVPSKSKSNVIPPQCDKKKIKNPEKPPKQKPFKAEQKVEENEKIKQKTKAVHNKPLNKEKTVKTETEQPEQVETVLPSGDGPTTVDSPPSVEGRGENIATPPTNEPKPDGSGDTALAIEEEATDGADETDTEGHCNMDTVTEETDSQTERAKSPIVKRKEEVSKDKGAQNKQKKESLPVRSLSDEEYQSIFTAAIEKALNMDINGWTPRCSSPKKISKPKKMKGKITVGKSVVTTNNPGKENMMPKFKNALKTKDPMQSKNKKKAKQKESQAVKQDDLIKDKEQHVEAVEPVDSDSDMDDNTDSESEADDVVQPPIQRTETQVENETTPTDSEDESEPQSPPKKKMKTAFKGVNKPKLEPRKLPFGREEVKSNEKKEKPPKTIDVKKTDLKTLERKFAEKKPVPKIKVKEFKNEKERKVSTKKVNRKTELLSREINLEGTWVQCCKTACMKWRYLPTVSDPSYIPEYWTCSMNTREEYNSCDKAEEAYDESDHIYTKYCEGSIVWAKMPGYPWWPAMVEIDPDMETYFMISENNEMVPTHYHCVFLDEKVSRVWVRANQLKPFNRDDERCTFNDSFKSKKKSIEKAVNSARRNAIMAFDYPIQERLKKFGFAAKYKGQWSTESTNGTVKSGHKEPKPVKKEKFAVKEEIIDDTTMDDVLSNTEVLLSNVEEMLDSIDSPMEDSDQDSNFSVDEMICVEGRKKSNDRRNKRKMYAQIYPDNSDDESMQMLAEVDATKPTEMSTIEIFVEDTEESMENKIPDKATDVHAEKIIKFDSEIFTMELTDDPSSDVIESRDVCGEDTKELEVTSMTAKSTHLDTCTKDSEFVNHGGKGNAKKRKMKTEDSKKGKKKKSAQISACHDEVNDKDRKGDENTMIIVREDGNEKPMQSSSDVIKKVEEERANTNLNLKNEKGITENTNKITVDQSVDDKTECMDNQTEVNNKSNHQSIIEKKDETPEVVEKYETSEVVEKHETSNVVEKDKTPEVVETDVTSETVEKQETSDVVEKHETSEVVVKDETSGLEEKGDKCQLSVTDSKEELEREDDNRPVPHVTPSSVLDDGDINLVPDVTGNSEEGAEHSTQEGISLEDDSDVDFDLDEQSMYDGASGADKLLERGVMFEVNDQSVVLDQEDSDPFDMIEE